jgi:hypothetical protein
MKEFKTSDDFKVVYIERILPITEKSFSKYQSSQRVKEQSVGEKLSPSGEKAKCQK